MMKSMFVSIIFLTIFLQSCNGQSNKGGLQNETPLNGTEKGHTLTQNNYYDITNINGRISQVVRTVFQDSKGNIWFGTQNGAFKLSDKDKSLAHIDNIRSELGKGVTIKDITEGKDGTIWFGHTDGLSSVNGTTVINYYESNGLISNDVWCISSDAEGKIWVGTIEGVCVFNGKNFVNFELPEGIRDTTVGVSSSKMIHSILSDRNGIIWFSTNAGLFSYKNSRLEHISDKVGIPSNFVGKIVEDKKGGFYISTSIGLFHLKGDDLTNISEKYFDESKGTGSVIVDSKGDILSLIHI